MLPYLGHRLQQIGARRAQIDLGLGKAGLNHGVVPDRAPGAAWNLVPGQIEEAVERAARDTAGDAGKADLVTGAVAHAVKRALFAALALELAGDRMICPDEEIVERKLVTRGPAQADRVPDIGPFDVVGANQHGA